MKKIVFCAFCVLFLHQTFGLPIIGEDAEQQSGNFEGDMILSAQQIAALKNQQSRNGLSADSYRWPNNTVPYRIAGSTFTTEQKNYIRRAVETIANASCLSFVEADENATRYIRVIDDTSGCFSEVGYQGNVQDLNLAQGSGATQIFATLSNLSIPDLAPNTLEQGCFRLGTIIHEFLHALGFYHMQSAADRDDYVTIVWENIAPGTENNFEKYNSTHVSNYGEEYDYGSVLHYSDTAFSTNGERTIIPRDESVTIGQRVGMSTSDVAKLRRMYNCE